MAILDNLEYSIWNEEPQNDGLALKIFSENCCDSCTCKSPKEESNCLCGNQVCNC